MVNIQLRTKVIEIKEKPRKDFSDMSPPVESLESVKTRFKQSVGVLPEDQQIQLFNEFITQALAITFPPPALLSPIETLKKNYTPFPHTVRMNAENIIAHLRMELKDYIRAFGANDDYIYLDEFKTVEPSFESLCAILSREHRINPKNLHISDILSKKTVRTQKEKHVKIKAVQDMEHAQALSFTQSFTS